MYTNIQPKRNAIAILISTIGAPTVIFAAPLELAQYPAGTAYKAPIPNVVLSIDTSASMTTYNSDGPRGTAVNRLNFVKDGLNKTLVESSKYNDQFRLAWQSFQCNSIPSSNGNCNNKNSMGRFSGDHKNNFKNWIQSLGATINLTPSSMLIHSAGEYLKNPLGRDNPWNASPGTEDPAPLGCRRAYHIFLTDGGWNFTYENNAITDTFKNGMLISTTTEVTQGGSTETTKTPTNTTIQNTDGSNQDLPDGTLYNINSDQTRIYRDTFGSNETKSISSSSTTGSWSNRKTTKITNNYAYPSLSDMAFYYWATDLQPSIENKNIPKIRKTGQETFTNDRRSVTLNEYWNPKNNPATWQNLVHYTIGYGSTASNLPKINSTSPQWTGGTFGMYDTGFTNLAVGNTKWDDVTSALADRNYDTYRPQDMWHMAINSRGKFYPVSGGDLSGVFSDIFDDIIVDNAVPISGFTSASGSVSRVGTQSFQTSYIATDDASTNNDRWHGYITSDSISTSGISSPNPSWDITSGGKHQSTADKLDKKDINKRLILTYDAYALTPQAVPFQWSKLSASDNAPSQTMWLNNGKISTGSANAIKAALEGDKLGQERLNFIRGDRTKEIRQIGGKFRNRKSRQGDIVNSAIWYTGAPTNGYTESSYKSFANTHRGRLPMLYVGGNDGMLHGFSAQDGTEKIAYIPHGVVRNLSALSDPNYSHKYYVDGSPFTGDIKIAENSTSDAWRTYLVGTLGAGGRGYFVLDVTKPGADSSFNVTPTSPAAPNTNFTEDDVSTLVVMDKTAAAISEEAPPVKPTDPNAHPDIGHIFGSPVVAESNHQRALQITRTNDGRWAFITGNGYNSSNESPVLLIQYLDGDKSLKTIPAAPAGSTEASGNGLSTPQLLDVNGDSIPDFVYAGDLRGNLWKFDISSAKANDWGVSFDGQPLFTANYSSAAGNSSRQPITAAPVLRPNRVVGGLMVAFGTGQNLTEFDRSDTSVQTVYSILDNTRYEIEGDGENKGKVKVKASEPTPTPINSRSDLQAESVIGGIGNGTAGAQASTGRSFWKLSNTEVIYACASDSTDCTAKKGWYMDLPVAGERVTTSFDFYDGSSILEIISEKPASGSATASGEEICAPQPQAAKTFRTLINIVSGITAKSPIMDVDGDGFYTSANDGGYARMTAPSKELRFGTRDKQIRKGNDGTEDKLAKLPELMLRPNWRQLK